MGKNHCYSLLFVMALEFSRIAQAFQFNDTSIITAGGTNHRKSCTNSVSDPAIIATDITST